MSRSDRRRAVPPSRRRGGAVRSLPRSILRPLQEFVSTSAAGATLLLVATVVALVWANSPWRAAYDDLWHTDVGAPLRGLGIGLDLDLRHWVNDGLMTLFFLVVGLEIKRELIAGELRDRRSAALPAIAALGGMVAPAAIYLAFTVGGDAASGWGIPMATDIAFALGVLTLAARHAPTHVKPFLLTLAIVDDIGAIAVIGLVYSGGLALGWLAAGGGLVAAIVGLQRLGVGAAAVYVALGAALWLVTLESGLHPTIAGVILGLVTPARPIRRRARPDAVAPLPRVEHLLLPWTTFLIVPVFALANAGVRISAGALSEAASSAVTAGVVVGLVVGKTVGISAAAWLAVRTGLGRLPPGVAWSHLVGTATVAGIGFTVSLFVTELAFDDAALVRQAKVGILAASILAGGLGLVLLRRAPAAIERDAPSDGA